MRYRAEIDGLRAVAVVPVVLFHAGVNAFSGGFVGVDVFFVISGYLITSIIMEAKARGDFSIVDFYERRARRILPALFIVMLASLFAAWVILLPNDMTNFSISLASVSVFSSNILFWSEAGYFDSAAELKPLLHTWSLAVEEQYYVFFPIIIALAWRFGEKFIFYMLMLIAILSFILAEMTVDRFPSAAFYLLPTRCWELLIGACAAIYLANKEELKGNQALSFLGLSMVIFSIFMFDQDTAFPSFYTLVPTLGVLLIVLFASENTVVYNLLSKKQMVGIGLISYSFYLWHQPVFAFYRHLNSGIVSEESIVLLTTVAALLSWISWRYIEAPFRDRRKISSRSILVWGVSLSAVFVVVGLFGYFTDGRVSRLAGNVDVVAREKIIDTAESERQELVGAGVCHFNGRGMGRSLVEFQEGWSCTYAARYPNLIDSGFAVFGDSHSADKAISLRLNGYGVMQLGGAGCSLTPRFGESQACAALREQFHVETAKNMIDKVIISNRFSKSELEVNAMQELVDYWSVRYKVVILFSPMPEFPDWVVNFIRTGDPVSRIDFSSNEKFYETIKAIHVPENVEIINSVELFCGISDKCHVVVGDELLLTDYGHLSAKGSEYFGKNFLALDYINPE